MATTRRTQQPAAPVALPRDIRAMQLATRVLLLLFVVLVAGLVAAALQRLPMFNLRQVSIGGDITRNSLPTMRANAVSKLAGNFFSLDLQQAKQAFEAVPWVRHAVVQRQWPNRLVVTLEEHKAAAEWQLVSSVASGRAQEGQLVNTAGEVFDANLGDVEDEDLPKLFGPTGTAADALAMLQRLQPLFEPMQSRVAELHLSERGSWSVVLNDDTENDSGRTGTEIQIGRGNPDEVAERVRRFVATVARATTHFNTELRSADLRYPQGYAIRLAGVGTVAASAPQPRKR